MAEAYDNLDVLIAQLSSPEAPRRELAARELFRQGCAAAEPVLAKWFSDPEFRGLAGKGNTLLTVGIAVHPDRFAAIHAVSGKPRFAEVPADQDVREFTLAFAHGIRLDVLTTSDSAGDGALARFLARHGEGIQQVECDLRDVDRATAILRDRFALQPIYPQTRAGADHTRVNFVLVPVPSKRGEAHAEQQPEKTESRKLLIEIVEVAARPGKQ